MSATRDVLRGILGRLTGSVGKVAGGVGTGLVMDIGRGSRDFLTGAYELPVQNALAEIVRPGDVVLDVGANIGFLTLIAARLAGPEGRVIAFEPVPANARLIRRNVALNGLQNVSVREEAAAAQDGEAVLVLAEHIGGATLLSAGVPDDARGRIRVKTRSIDTLVDRGEIPAPAVVKIDVEGAERDVLLGMGQVLARHRPVLLIELDGRREAEVEHKAAQCGAILEAAGYRLASLPPSYKTEWVVRHVLARPSSARGERVEVDGR